jgi:hypothetical protein
MTDRHDREDELLREGFRRVRVEEEATAPSFAALMARARSGVTPGEVAVGEISAAATPASAAPGDIPSPPVPSIPVTRIRWRRWLPPLVAAAALAAVLIPESGRADREFDRLVNEWSETARVALHSPTDRLLAVPGSQYLRSVPSVGADRPASTSPLRSRP